jgi:hypothetical protein
MCVCASYAEQRTHCPSHKNFTLYTGIKLPNDMMLMHTFPDLIRLVGRDSQEIVSVTLRFTVDTEGTGPEFPFCFAGELRFVGGVLAGVGELL